jgi:hypothetical protein
MLPSQTPGREGGALGVVSLEDVIEEMIGEEIVDETVRFHPSSPRSFTDESGETGRVRRLAFESQGRARTGQKGRRRKSTRTSHPR